MRNIKNKLILMLRALSSYLLKNLNFKFNEVYKYIINRTC